MMHTKQSFLEKAINVQADIIRIQRRIPELGPKAAERYVEWAKTLSAAVDVYNNLAQEGNQWIILSQRSRQNT